MKNSIRVLALVMVAVMLCLTLTSCGKKLSGTYSTKEVLASATTLEFKGSKVTIAVKVFGTQLDEVVGKYEIEDDQITFTFESDKDEVEEYNGTFDFKENDDGSITIGAFGKFEKQD